MPDVPEGVDRGGSLWWRRDSRWSLSAAVAGIGTVVGIVAASVMPGLGGILGSEAGVGVAAGFVVVASAQLRRAYRRRADDDAETYTDGAGYELAATGTVSPGPIATITRDDAHTASGIELQREALTAARGPAVNTITVRIRGARLRLQHRLGSEGDLDDGELPDLVVRWVDENDTAVAGAHRLGCHWTVPGAQLTLELDVPADRRRRPSRRTFLDSDGRAFLLTCRTRRRLPILHFEAPAELEPAEVVLCLWLGQLLDAHAAAGEHWRARSTDWTLVEDDFPSFVGPGGFGRTHERYLGHANVGYNI